MSDGEGEGEIVLVQIQNDVFATVNEKGKLTVTSPDGKHPYTRTYPQQLPAAVPRPYGQSSARQLHERRSRVREPCVPQARQIALSSSVSALCRCSAVSLRPAYPPPPSSTPAQERRLDTDSPRRNRCITEERARCSQSTTGDIKAGQRRAVEQRRDLGLPFEPRVARSFLRLELLRRQLSGLFSNNRDAVEPTALSLIPFGHRSRPAGPVGDDASRRDAHTYHMVLTYIDKVVLLLATKSAETLDVNLRLHGQFSSCRGATNF
jgi:hypothetical protein